MDTSTSGPMPGLASCSIPLRARPGATGLQPHVEQENFLGAVLWRSLVKGNTGQTSKKSDRHECTFCHFFPGRCRWRLILQRQRHDNKTLVPVIVRETIKVVCMCVCECVGVCVSVWVCVCARVRVVSGYCTLTVIPLDIIPGQQVTSRPPCSRICSPHRAVWTLSAEKCHPAPFIFMVTHKQETGPVHDIVTFSYLKSFYENEKKNTPNQTKELSCLMLSGPK